MVIGGYERAPLLITHAGHRQEGAGGATAGPGGISAGAAELVEGGVDLGHPHPGACAIHTVGEARCEPAIALQDGMGVAPAADLVAPPGDVLRIELLLPSAERALLGLEAVFGDFSHGAGDIHHRRGRVGGLLRQPLQSGAHLAIIDVDTDHGLHYLKAIDARVRRARPRSIGLTAVTPRRGYSLLRKIPLR